MPVTFLLMVSSSVADPGACTSTGLTEDDEALWVSRESRLGPLDFLPNSLTFSVGMKLQQPQ